MIDRFEFGEEVCQPRRGGNVVLKEEGEEAPRASLNPDRRGENRGLHYCVTYSRIGGICSILDSSAPALFFEWLFCPPPFPLSLKSPKRLSMETISLSSIAKSRSTG